MDMQNKLHMSADDALKFRSLFATFCKGEIESSQSREYCKYEGCEYCPINAAYHFLFDDCDLDDNSEEN